MRQEASAQDAKHTSWSVKHGGGDGSAAWLLLGRAHWASFMMSHVLLQLNKLRSLQNLSVCQCKDRWNQTDHEILDCAARQRPRTQNNQGVHQRREDGLRLKRISRLINMLRFLPAEGDWMNKYCFTLICYSLCSWTFAHLKVNNRCNRSGWKYLE